MEIEELIQILKTFHPKAKISILHNDEDLQINGLVERHDDEVQIIAVQTDLGLD